MGRGHLVGGDARLAVDPQAQGVGPIGNGEQRLGRPRQGAAGERHAQRAGRLIGPARRGLHRVQVPPGRGRRTGRLDHEQVAGDTAPVVVVLDRVGGDIVRDRDDPRVQAGGDQGVAGHSEVQDVAGVVAEQEQAAAAVVGRAHHRLHLGGRGGGEDVPAHRPVGHAGPHPSGEGRVVPRTATHHHAHLAVRAGRRAHHAAVHGLHVRPVRRDHPPEGLGGELPGVIDEMCHCDVLSCASEAGPADLWPAA